MKSPHCNTPYDELGETDLLNFSFPQDYRLPICLKCASWIPS
jgi:hypothetical protein